MKNNTLHSNFKLNGKHFDSENDLLHFVKNHLNHVYIFLSEWFDDSNFVTVSTSGSTGKPKKIQLRKEFMVNSAKATGDYFDLNKNTRALICLPVEFIAGKMMLVRSMVLGWDVDLISSDAYPLKGIKKNYDFSAMVPLQLYNSLEQIDKIEKVIVGGGEASVDLQSKIKELPTKIFATYGMTETITHIAVKPLNSAAGFIQGKDYFQTLDKVVIRKDNRGCLVINAPKVTDEIIITNDLVEIISENQFKWLGRYDHIINSAGIKLIPEQIEQKLSKIVKQRFFVAGNPDDVLGEKLILIVEGEIQEDLASQISKLKTLSKYEVPKNIYSIELFAETETKKIQRQKTLELLL